MITVKEGYNQLSLGTHNLTFHNAVMVHWPEVIVSYESTEKVLFSADAFVPGVIDVEEDWTDEARRYYYNVCGKYGSQVRRLLKTISNP